MIRAAQDGDVATIAALWNWMIRDTLATFTNAQKSRAEVQALLDTRRDAFFVCEIEGSVRGFAHFGAFRSGPGYAATCEHSLIVAPEAQGQGIGKALMQALLDSARARGMHVMVAGISGTNTAAIRFHAALGFREVGRMPQVGRKAGQWLDLVLMQKTLRAAD